MSSRVAVEVTVEAQPADVFAAWTDNDKLQQWFAEYADVSVDEGRFNFWGKHTVGNPSSEAANHELRDVQQGKSLAFEWHLRGRDTEVSVALHPHDRGTHIVVHHDGVAGWERFCEATPDVIVTDMVMPRSYGLELLGRIRSRSDVPVILFTGRGTVQAAASAFKAGADDFVSAPDVDIDELIALVGNAVAGGRGTSGALALKERLVGESITVSPKG